MRFIDLNADLGEGCGNDRALLELVSSASICCGGHAGGPREMLETLAMAKECGVAVGAHPGYADRAHFGRKEQSIPSDQLAEMIQSQLEELDACARQVGLPLRFIKPHGALYQQAQRETEIASVVVAVAVSWKLPLVGQPASRLAAIASACGHPYIAEGFPDRRYRGDGSLVPRSAPNALIGESEEFEEQVKRLVGESDIRTLCVHGDEPLAVLNATRIRSMLVGLDVAIRAFAHEID